MRTGPTKKLDYEKGKLKAKVAQPDYRDRIVEEGDNYDRGGLPPRHLTLSDAVKGDFSKIWRDEKLRAIEFYERQLRSVRVKVGARIFKFKIKVAQFAKENGISINVGNRLLPEVTREAEARLEMTMQRARKAALESYESALEPCGKTRRGWRLRFRTFLPTIERIEWHKIYKRVELCPTEEDCDA